MDKFKLIEYVYISGCSLIGGIIYLQGLEFFPAVAIMSGWVGSMIAVTYVVKNRDIQHLELAEEGDDDEMD